MIAGDVSGDVAHHPLGLAHVNVRLQSSKHCVRKTATPLFGELGWGKRHRHPKFVARIELFEIGRRNAHYLITLSVELKRPLNRADISVEQSLPQPRAQNNDVLITESILVIAKEPAARSASAEHRREARGR